MAYLGVIFIVIHFFFDERIAGWGKNEFLKTSYLSLFDFLVMLTTIHVSLMSYLITSYKGRGVNAKHPVEYVQI